jgi:hypothetical protein
LKSRITPTCFGIQIPSSGGYTFLVSYSSFVCVSGGCGLWFARCSQLLRNAAAAGTERTSTRDADKTGVDYEESATS